MIEIRKWDECEIALETLKLIIDDDSLIWDELLERLNEWEVISNRTIDNDLDELLNAIGSVNRGKLLIALDADDIAQINAI